MASADSITAKAMRMGRALASSSLYPQKRSQHSKRGEGIRLGV